MLTATLRLEQIGWASNRVMEPSDGYKKRGHGLSLPKKRGAPWVAVIEGTCPHYGLKRRFLPGHLDFDDATGSGERGVYRHYHLEEGGLFEVHEHVSWGRNRRWFCIVDQGDICEIEEERALKRAETMDYEGA